MQFFALGLPTTPVLEIQSYPGKQALPELGGEQGANICFLDMITDEAAALALIPDIIAAQPLMKVVVLLPPDYPDGILKAVRQGAVEFLVRPFDPDAFDHVVERIANLQRSERANSSAKIISVVPVKGACGSTTIASNLARHFKRAGFEKILLADLDPLTGTLSFLLKLKSNYSFTDVLSRSSGLDAGMWRNIVTNNNGIDVLLSPELASQALQELKDASLILEFARAEYQIVIFDLGNVYGAWNLSLTRNSDQVLLVTTNELPSLQAAQRAADYLESNHIAASKIRLVVNRYSKDHGVSREVIESALRPEIFHVLPSDYEGIQKALMEGKASSPSTAFGKAVTQLGDLLVPRPKSVAGAPQRTSAISTLLSMFSKPTVKHAGNA